MKKMPVTSFEFTVTKRTVTVERGTITLFAPTQKAAEDYFFSNPDYILWPYEEDLDTESSSSTYELDYIEE